MKPKSTNCVYDPLYLFYLQRQEQLRLPEKQRDEKEIKKIEAILFREAPHYLIPEGESILIN
jgi:hypothetical protein